MAIVNCLFVTLLIFTFFFTYVKTVILHFLSFNLSYITYFLKFNSLFCNFVSNFHAY